MKIYNEILVKDIPCICYLKNTPVNLYLGPKLIGPDREKLRDIENDYLVLYMHDVLDGITQETLSYTFPGLSFPDPFSAYTIFDTIRKPINVKINPDCKCIVRHNGESFVVYVGTSSIEDIITYLVDKGLKYNPSQNNTPKPRKDDTGTNSIDESNTLSQKRNVENLSTNDVDHIRFRAGENVDGNDCLLRRSTDEPPKSTVQVNVDPKPTTAEDNFDYEMTKAASEVKKAIEDLLLTGFPMWAIQAWLNDYAKRSRLRITRQFKILLVDYDKEIKMGPLPKTVFLFFLRHPNGVRFSCLQDHYEELYHIYERVSVNDDPQKMRESIDALVNPLSNSINEKCAAIKKAFLLQVNESIAKEYYVTSRLAGFKGIILDRSLVEWECKL